MQTNSSAPYNKSEISALVALFKTHVGNSSTNLLAQVRSRKKNGQFPAFQLKSREEYKKTIDAKNYESKVIKPTIALYNFDDDDESPPLVTTRLMIMATSGTNMDKKVKDLDKAPNGTLHILKSTVTNSSLLFQLFLWYKLYYDITNNANAENALPKILTKRINTKKLQPVVIVVEKNVQANLVFIKLLKNPKKKDLDKYEKCDLDIEVAHDDQSTEINETLLDAEPIQLYINKNTEIQCNLVSTTMLSMLKSFAKKEKTVTVSFPTNDDMLKVKKSSKKADDEDKIQKLVDGLFKAIVDGEKVANLVTKLSAGPKEGSKKTLLRIPSVSFVQMKEKENAIYRTENGVNVGVHIKKNNNAKKSAQSEWNTLMESYLVSEESKKEEFKTLLEGFVIPRVLEKIKGSNELVQETKFKQDVDMVKDIVVEEKQKIAIQPKFVNPKVSTVNSSKLVQRLAEAANNALIPAYIDSGSKDGQEYPTFTGEYPFRPEVGLPTLAELSEAMRGVANKDVMSISLSAMKKG